jgi:3',5'-cyclic AMP phosphodiesterase CpdA
MPFVLDSRPDRRTFLTVTGSALVGLAAARPNTARAQAASAAGGGPVRLALLSDTHIPADATEAYRNFRPVDNLRTVAAQVADADVSGCLVAGDLARLIGTPDDYTALVQLLRPISDRRPVGLLLGNHDNREHFLRAVPTSAGTPQAVRNKHVMVIEQAGLRFVLLDSLLAPNVTPGQLGNAQRTWLREFLGTAPALPTAVFVHHTLDDNDGALMDSDRLFDVLRPFAHVKAVVYGHSHRYHVDEREGIQLINLPAVGYNFADTEPVGWLESAWTPTGVDLTLRAIGGNQAAQGQTRSVRWLR